MQRTACVLLLPFTFVVADSAVSQQLSRELAQPQKTFQEQAAAAMARLRPQTNFTLTPSRPKQQPAGDRISSADPLQQLNATYYRQSRELARIAPTLPAELRQQVETEIKTLLAKRQALSQYRKHRPTVTTTEPAWKRANALRVRAQPASGNTAQQTAKRTPQATPSSLYDGAPKIEAKSAKIPAARRRPTRENATARNPGAVPRR